MKVYIMNDDELINVYKNDYYAVMFALLQIFNATKKHEDDTVHNLAKEALLRANFVGSDGTRWNPNESYINKCENGDL